LTRSAKCCLGVVYRETDHGRHTRRRLQDAKATYGTGGTAIMQRLLPTKVRPTHGLKTFIYSTVWVTGAVWNDREASKTRYCLVVKALTF
jgi:hypothetical protein